MERIYLDTSNLAMLARIRVNNPNRFKAFLETRRLERIVDKEPLASYLRF